MRSFRDPCRTPLAGLLVGVKLGEDRVKTRIPNSWELKKRVQSGCPHCGSELEAGLKKGTKRPDRAGLIWFCNSPDCPVRSEGPGEYYYISATAERVFKK